MINSLSLKQVKEMMIFVSGRIISNKDRLNELDRMIGDGDHGDAMTRGFKFVIENLNEEHFNNCEEVFLEIGNDLLRSVGGCSGIIFGTFFRSGSKALNGTQEINASNIAEFLKASLEAIMKRGGAKLGDKTLVDALSPAVDKAEEMKKNEGNLVNVLKDIADAAHEGLEETKSIKASIGRAKTYGDKSLGYADPGATTTFLILQSMTDYVADLSSNNH
jgi:dihydroxyacetone kinase-like protein